MKKYIFLFTINILILFFYSCNKDKRIKLEFKVQQDIECVSMPYQDILGLTMQVLKKGNLLFINDFRGDTLIHIYDVEKRQFIRKLIPVGNGPNELISPVEIHIENNNLFIFYRQASLMYFISTDSIMNGNKGMMEKFKVPIEANLVFPISDSLFISSGFYQKRYALFNHIGELIHEFGEYPTYWNKERKIPYQARAMFHQTSFEKHSTASLFLTYSPHVLEIYDYGTGINPPDLLQSICIGKYNYSYINDGNILMVEKGKDVEKGIISVSCSSDFIYILYDYAKDNQENTNAKIQVIDWKGNPIKILNIQKETRCLYIDEKEGRGYIIAELPDDTLMYFNIDK